MLRAGEDLRDYVVRHIKFGEEQRERAEAAEQELEKLKKEHETLKKEHEKLQVERDTDVLFKAMSDNYDKCKELNTQLTARCAQSKKQLENTRKDLKVAIEDLLSTRGELHVANHMIKIMRLILINHGIDFPKDPVFIYMMKDLINQLPPNEAEYVKGVLEKKQKE